MEKETNEIGVFILVSDYVKDGEKGTEINAVYKSREGAEKMGKWLMESKKINGIKYTNYRIENFIVL